LVAASAFGPPSANALTYRETSESSCSALTL
jgi:hypothetical protein